jgi:hypothetical protein
MDWLKENPREARCLLPNMFFFFPSCFLQIWGPMGRPMILFVNYLLFRLLQTHSWMFSVRCAALSIGHCHCHCDSPAARPLLHHLMETGTGTRFQILGSNTIMSKSRHALHFEHGTSCNIELRIGLGWFVFLSTVWVKPNWTTDWTPPKAGRFEWWFDMLNVCLWLGFASTIFWGSNTRRKSQGSQR